MSIQDQRSEFSFAQRLIQKFLGTREVAVLVVFGACIVVELGILAATQQYEASQAVQGSILWWGMSAAGIIAFLAEVLKLPVAWVSGVMSGKKRWFLHVVMIGLCLLTLLTVKDLTVREWTLALAPSRAVSAQSVAIEEQIASLEQEKTELTQNRETRLEEFRRQQGQLRATREAITAEMASGYSEFKAAEQTAAAEALGEGASRRLSALMRRREDANQSLERSIEGIDAQVKTLSNQAGVAEASEPAEAKWLQLYQQREQAYRADIKRIRDEAERLLADKQGFFDGNDRLKIERNRDEQLAEAQRIFDDALPRQLASQSNGDIPLEQLTQLRAQRISAESTHRQVLAELAIEEDKLLAEADAASGSKAQLVEVREEWRRLKASIDERQRRNDESLESVNSQIAQLNGVGAGGVEQRVTEIIKQLPLLKQQAKQLSLEAAQLGRDTIPMRTVDGLVRFMMPEATTEEQLQAAFAVFPFVFAILIAFMPAIIIEVCAYSLRPGAMNSERRHGWMARMTRGRRAVLLIRKRAADCVREYEASLTDLQRTRGELELRDRVRSLEHQQATSELDLRISEAVTSATKELAEREVQLQARLASQLADIHRLNGECEDLLRDKANLRDDLSRLLSGPIVVDASARANVRTIQ